MTRPTRTGRRPVRALRTLPALAVAALLLAGAGLAQVAAPAPAAAHDSLVATTPADGAVVATTPGEVRLRFDQPALAVGTDLVVAGPGGQVQVGKPRLVDTTVSQSLRPGSPAGAYTVTWRVTSVDGHAVSGTFGFTASAASTATATAGTPAAGGSTAASPPGDGSPVLWVVVTALLCAAAAVVVVRVRRSRAGGHGPG